MPTENQPEACEDGAGREIASNTTEGGGCKVCVAEKGADCVGSLEWSYDANGREVER